MKTTEELKHVPFEMYARVLDRAAKAKAERDSLREALSFYADERNWHTPPHCYSAAVSDYGTKARAALAPSTADKEE